MRELSAYLKSNRVHVISPPQYHKQQENANLATSTNGNAEFITVITKRQFMQKSKSRQNSPECVL